MSDAAEPAVLQAPGADALELPVHEASEGSPAADISKLLAKHRVGHLRPRLRQHRLVLVGDHLH